MKKALVLLAALALAGCASIPCGVLRPCPGPTPTPTPGPTPTPTPTPGVPPKGQAVLPNLLLRAPNPPALVRGGEPFKPNGYTQCCRAIVVAGKKVQPAEDPYQVLRKPPAEDPYQEIAPLHTRVHRGPKKMKVRGVEINSRWPSISVEAMNFAHREGGSNFFSMRVAPYYGDADHESEWQDIGGPVLPGQWPNWNQPWWDKNREQIWHAGSVLNANFVVEWDAWYGKTCKTGQEPCAWPQSEVQAWGETFTEGHKRFIDKIVEEFGCFMNVVWQVDNEGALVPRAKREYYEKVSWAFRDAEQRLGCGVVHMIGTNWVEIGDGPFDFVVTHQDAALTQPFYGKHSANNEHNADYTPEKDLARYCAAQDAGLHYWYWRADSSDADQLEALRLRKAGCGAGPIGCFPPESEDPLWGQPVPGPGFEKQAVVEAQNQMGERCGSVPPHEGGLATLDLLGAQLRAMGRCAGRSADSVFVLASDGQWEEYHAVRFTDGCWSEDPKQYPKLRWPYNGANPQPACNNPAPLPVSRWNAKVHNRGPVWITLDSTPIVGPDAAYCAAIGYTDGRSLCSVRQEGDPARVACETAVVGVPQWTAPLGRVHPDNPYMYQISTADLTAPIDAQVCTSRQPPVCGVISVTP